MIDYELLFKSAPIAFLLLTPDLKIADANDAYLHATMTSKSNLINKYVFDIFPDNPYDRDNNGSEIVKKSFKKVLTTGLPDAMEIQKYDIKRPDGTWEERYWLPLNSPVFDSDKNVIFIMHMVKDVTDFMKMKTKCDNFEKIEAEICEKFTRINKKIKERVASLT